MRINAALRTELETFARKDNRTLSNFVETELRNLTSAAGRNHVRLRRPREVHSSTLSLRIDAAVKSGLEKLALQDYRNLTNFVGVLLVQMVASRKLKGLRSCRMGARTNNNYSPPGGQARAGYIGVNINTHLKAELKDLAREGNCTLTDLINAEFERVIRDGRADCSLQMPPRGKRIADLSMRIDAQVKAKLQKMADEQYRALTDFVEIALHRSVSDRGGQKE